MPLYTFYKIVCKDENIKDCYVGKTTNLNKRIRSHKSKCNNVKSAEYNYKLYQFIRENGNIDNWNIIEIDKGEYDDKDSSIRERYWIEKLNANLNIQKPSRTRKEWSKQNNKNNREIQNEKLQIWRNNLTDEKRKEINEKRKEKDKEYRDKNKEKLNEKFICCCGGKYTKTGKSKHFKTKKHQEYLLNDIK
jgi:hypothetical protein